MNLDDESLLSAYLDDELDPADRLAVEWSVESSPPLADQLRALATARDAVAGLGRPVLPVDLAPAIAVRLAADRRRARLRALARPGRVAVAVAGLSAMAASLLFALFLLHRSMHESPDRPIVALGNPSDPSPRPHPIDHPEAPPTPLTRFAKNGSAPSPREQGPTEPLAVAPPDEARDREDRLRITRMLEKPNVRLVLITTDVIDASDQVQGLIQKDARKSPDFGRITLRAGIVVDPRRPGSAEVFVVPIDEGGRRSFLDRLGVVFSGLKEEGDPGPDLVTQLTEIGHVAVFQGTQASPLIEPPGEVRPFIVASKPPEPGPDHFSGLKVVPSRGRNPNIPSPMHGGGVGDLGAEAVASGPSQGPGPKAAGDPGPPVTPAPSGQGESVTLLVWVTRPSEH